MNKLEEQIVNGMQDYSTMLAAVVRFLMSIFAAKEQLVSEFRTKPKFPSGGISSVGT